jgi:Flp pilus assembly protein TadB
MESDRSREGVFVNRESRPMLITDAEHSRDDQLKRRQVRYILMMSVRAVCLVLAAILVSVRAPLPWLWAPLLVLGMVLVPWLAVILANDRPPKPEHRLGARLRQRDNPGGGPKALGHAGPSKVIDAD